MREAAGFCFTRLRTGPGARMGAYQEAIARAVKPGAVVVDLGCGPGLLSLLACRAGAKRVYAIETNESVAFARELAAANGCADRIEILHGSSRRMSLPERADVIVSDVRGVLPLFGEAMASIEDARQRFLAPGGRMIPATDRLHAALVSVPEFYAQIATPWQDSMNGVCLSAMCERALNSTYSVRFDGGKLASDALECGRCRRGSAARFARDPVGGTYIWRWDTAFSAAGSAAGRRFAQSTLESARFAPDVLRRRSMDFTPKLAAAGEAEAWVLQRMDGTRSLQQLAEAAAAQFPELFLNTQEATELVCRLSEKFST